jgi:hypothetical protein
VSALHTAGKNFKPAGVSSAERESLNGGVDAVNLAPFSSSIASISHAVPIGVFGMLIPA